MKKTIKEHCRDIMLYIGTGSVFLTSCAAPIIQDFSQENFAENSNVGVNLLPLDIYLSGEQVKYVQFVRKFAKDVLNKPELSKSFKSNPKLILEKYGLSEMDIDIHSQDIQLLLSLGDEDVVKCVKNKNFAGFMRTLESKNLLQTKKVQKLNKIIKQYNSKSSDATTDFNNEIDIQESLVFILCAAVFEYVVVVAVGAVIVVGWASLGVRTHTGTYTTTTSSGNGGNRPNCNGLNDNYQDRYYSRTDRCDKYIDLYDQYINQFLDNNIIRVWEKIGGSGSLNAISIDTDSNTTKINEALKYIGEKYNISSEDMKIIANFAYGTAEQLITAIDNENEIQN